MAGTSALAQQRDATRDRLLGALVGLATGDALGTTLEFHAPGSFDPISDIVGGGPFDLKPGEWTDDTTMALCLAESLVECDGFDAADQMRRYLRWYRKGYLSVKGRCFDIGPTTAAALRRFENTGDPIAGDTDPYTAGNGSIMRLAPVPIFFAAQPEQALDLCAQSSRITHAAQAAVDACRYLGALILGAVRGEDKEVLLSPHYSPVPNYWKANPLVPEIAEVAEGSFKRRNPPEIQGTVYCVRSLEAALWAFHHGSDFRDGALRAVNLGDDADSTGAVYGQVAGAYYGATGIPTEWRERLAMRATIEQLADALAERSLHA
jgi:ADP-ribosylglycohydrolase